MTSTLIAAGHRQMLEPRNKIVLGCTGLWNGILVSEKCCGIKKWRYYGITGHLLNTATGGLAVMTVSTLFQGRNQEFIDHSQSGVVCNFGLVSLSVCLSACLSEDNFRKAWRREFIFAHPVYLQGIRVRFIY